MIQQYLFKTDLFYLIDVLEKKSDFVLYKKGQLIYCEGSTPIGIHFVREGKVKITKTGSDSKEQILRIVSQEQILNLADFVSNTKYSTSAVALEDTTVMFVPKIEFWNTLMEEHQLYQDLMIMLSTDLKEAEMKITDIAYKPVRGRLADALILLDKKSEKRNEPSMNLSISRSDLACLVGTAKETVNRLVSEFRNERLIKTEGNKIIILNQNGLNMISKMYE